MKVPMGVVVHKTASRLVDPAKGLLGKFEAVAELMRHDTGYQAVEFEHDGDIITARRGFTGAELHKNYRLARAGKQCGRSLRDLDDAARLAAEMIG